MRLRIDPWDPEYGASVEFDEDLAPAAGLDLSVEEAGKWESIEAPDPREDVCCAFVDGVRRIDARLYAETDAGEAPGLCGSWAVGAAWSLLPPTISDVEVGREVIVGAGLSPPAMTTKVGDGAIPFEPRSVSGSTPLDPIQGLQNSMREAEGRLAGVILESGRAELLVSDGPLTYFASGPLVGMIKRQSRPYLDADRAGVLPKLKPGERTPIFKVGEDSLERYTWYLRLAHGRAIDGAMAGIVRLEVAARDGLNTAKQLAEFAGGVLPRFATKPGRDPRAPQQLQPISALEQTLRHRLGDALLIRRAIETHLLEELVNG